MSNGITKKIRAGPDPHATGYTPGSPVLAKPLELLVADLILVTNVLFVAYRGGVKTTMYQLFETILRTDPERCRWRTLNVLRQATLETRVDQCQHYQREKREGCCGQSEVSSGHDSGEGVAVQLQRYFSLFIHT